MNGKKSRALRKTALELTKGKPMVEYIGGEKRKQCICDKTGMDYWSQNKPLELAPSCTRYIYQKTKRSLKHLTAA